MILVFILSYIGTAFIGAVIALTILYAVIEHMDKKMERERQKKMTAVADEADEDPFNLIQN